MLDSYACDLPGQKIDLEQELCVGYVPRKPMVATFQRDPSSSSSSHGGVGGGFRMVAATATEFYNFIGFKDACQASVMLIKHNNSNSEITLLQLPASLLL